MSQRRFHIPTSVLALPVLVACVSCAAVKGMFPASSDGDAALVQVDDLVGRIERIHVDCELAGQNIAATSESLRTMVGPEFIGEPEFAHADLVAAIELSERQAEDMRSDFKKMESSAKRVFAQWEKNLESFSSDSMREHSAERLQSMRERYDSVLTVVGPAMEGYFTFNASVRDHALYLGTAFNEESVSLVEKELRKLFRTAESLTGDFEQCTDACQSYVRKSALRGQVVPRGRRSV